MIFQKKIIIGSIMSFIATAVGIIAVFFPDLLNLQKERIETIVLDVISEEDVEKVNKFLSNRVQDDKFFELDLLVPNVRDNMDKPERIFVNKSLDGLDTEVHIRDKDADNITTDLDGKNVFWYQIVQDNGEVYEESTSFHFPDNASFYCDQYGGTRKSLDKKIEFCGIRIKGYFYYSPEDSNPDYRIYVFKKLSKEQLKLKNY
ncbi:MAG: hypothetical protein Q4A60_04400 [Pasteurellaceae bacterium]|nr:hypothetical protein [Pasteurellaceae bacterium]